MPRALKSSTSSAFDKPYRAPSGAPSRASGFGGEEQDMINHFAVRVARSPHLYTEQDARKAIAALRADSIDPRLSQWLRDQRAAYAEALERALGTISEVQP